MKNDFVLLISNRSGTERQFASSAEGLVLSGPVRPALPSAAARGILAG